MRRVVPSLLIVIGVITGVVAPLSSGAYFTPVPHAIALQLRGHASPLRWASAHRGEQLAGPDNSLMAIRGAARAGIRLIEVDIRRNADGTLFLFHDRTLRRQNFSGPASLIGRRAESLSDHELRSVYHPGTAPTRIPTFAEALEAIRDCDCALQLDVKRRSTAIIDLLVRTARAQGQAHQIVVQAPRLAMLAYVRDRYPDIAVLARCRSVTEVRQAMAESPHIIQIDAAWMTPEIIREIHASGAKILVKTLYEQDHEAAWERLLAAGIDILLTGKPVQLTDHIHASMAVAYPH